jgi:hypothetical protein
MKFKMLVRETKTGREWWENYDKDVSDVEEFCKHAVEEIWNGNLRPHEKKREFIKCEIIENSNDKFHKWFKLTSGMSVEFRGQIVDLVKCSVCGITGKRYGLDDKVKIDSKYRKKAFQNCDTSQKEQKA